MKPYDWTAIAAEISAYLDDLDPKQRPMPLTSWALVLGLSKSNLYARHRTHRDCPFARVWTRYRAVESAWIATLGTELAKRQGTRCGWTDLAREYGLTYSQLTGLTVTCEKRGLLQRQRREPLSIQRILKAARVGMTRQDLADALGITIHRMESLLRADRRHQPMMAALHESLIWEPRQGNRPAVIKAVRRSKWVTM